MEKPELKLTFPYRQLTVAQTVIAVFLLAVLCIGFYNNVLSAGWRFDDGDHLNFASTYSPWQYFFIPEITRLQSGANLTPWNTLFYDINLSLFGLNPSGFYTHQLIIIGLTSIATFFLLKLWIAPAWSLIGALVFMIGAPTVHIANEIMTGHYSSGLLFVVIALYAFVCAVRLEQNRYALIGAFFYLLAVTCKEIYVPLVVILPFLPAGTLKSRLRFSIAFLSVFMIYIFWRFQVLGRLFGGYNLHGNYDLFLILETFGNIPLLLFGNHLIGKLAITIMIMLLLMSYKQVNWKLTLVAVGAILFPLIPLVSFPGVTAADRYLFLAGWGLSILLACLLSIFANKVNKNLAWLACVVLVSINLAHSRTEQQNLSKVAAPTEQSYQFMLSSNANQVYIAPDFDYYFGAVLPGAVAAQKHLLPSSPERASIIPDIEQLATINLTTHSVWSYSNYCQCIENVTSSVTDKITDYRSRLIDRELSVSLNFEKLKVEWRLGPYVDGEYTIMINNQGFFSLPPHGAHSYPRKTLEGYILYQSPQGWITKSPQFNIDTSTQSHWEWSRL